MNVASAKITSKGQITIPAEIRKALAMEPGDRLSFVVDGDAVRVERQQSWVERTAGILRSTEPRPPLTEREMKQLKETAWADEAVERDARSQRR